MVEIFRRKRLNVPVAPLVASGLAAVAAALFAFMPGSRLDSLALDSGIAALIPAAEPPLGFTARAVLMAIAAGGVGSIVWFGLYLLIGTRTVALFGRQDQGSTFHVPILRRADAHPDAPARRPLFANSDLGTPFLEVRAPVHLVIADDVEEAVYVPAPPPSAEPEAVELVDSPVAVSVVVPIVIPAAPAEADLPKDLDQPLAAFDPQAIPAEPLEWFIPATPALQQERPQTFAPTERFETFVLRPAGDRPARGDTPFDASASIHSLLDRLEKGVGRREPDVAKVPVPTRNDSLQDALTTLRKLAAR